VAEKDKKYYWLKLKRDFFKRHDIQIIEGMPNGKDYILFYLKLLCESVDHDGNLRFSEEIPYNEEMLATITNTNVDIVRSAVKLFAGLNMIDILDDGTYYMTQVQKMIGSETYWAQKKREQKALPTLQNGSRRLNANTLRLPNGTIKNVDEKRYGGNGMLVMDRSGGKCEVCGSEEKILIHHNNGYSNDPEDLIVLCAKCHGQAHSIKMGGKVPTPSNEIPICPSKSIEKDIDKELDIEIESDSDSPNPPPPKPKKPVKHKYGEYKNVLLTDEEVEKLQKEFGDKMTKECITFLDEYIEYKGYKAKSHYLAIRKWVVDAVNEKVFKRQKANNKNTSSMKGTYDLDAFERMLDAKDNPPPTAAEDENIRARAEALQKELAGK